MTSTRVRISRNVFTFTPVDLDHDLTLHSPEHRSETPERLSTPRGGALEAGSPIPTYV